MTAPRHCSGEDGVTQEVWEVDGEGDIVDLLQESLTFAKELEADGRDFTIEHAKGGDDDPFEVLVFTIEK